MALDIDASLDVARNIDMDITTFVTGTNVDILSYF